MKQVESVLESWIFRARWLLAPFFVGLLVAIVAVLYKFMKQLWALLVAAFGSGSDELIIANILTLVDSALIGALLLIIGFSGYENFVSKIATGEHEDRPAWMGKVGFSDLKIKLMGAIVAISAVELLKAFINVDQLSNTELAWRVGIHMAFVASGVLFAITDRITESKGGHH
jgi:uncharacterized protein (TIGR00645 family)